MTSPKQEKIVKIEKIEYDDYVYDLEVDDSHTFMANDIFVHNTDSRFLIYEGDLSIKEQYDLIQKTKKKMFDYMKCFIPFFNDNFDLESETGSKPLKYIKFVQDHGKFLKKNYIMLTHDDKVMIKGLPIIKNNSTRIGKIILNKYLIPGIIRNGNVNFKESQVLGWIQEELIKDMGLASIRYKVNSSDSYKIKGCLQAKLSRKYFNGGPGVVDVIKLKNGDYVSIKEKNKYNLFNICYDKIKNEIKPFLVNEQMCLGGFL